ncbi:hypothetical protein L6452_10524 [Arctium lappa]|uniref:Uncharacterized protein n=1 Tax=Arctium lappa TaxID=4217 RepID=A0ACB9DMR6_ARCLA|nr:hypothetical protein L6452_10524 [Arctium lappa]
MDLQILNKGFAFAYTHKTKKRILLIAALGFSTYAAYKVSTLPSVTKKRARAMKLLRALASILQFLGDSADTLGVISKDLKHFIQSDSDQIPNSLRQLLKITRSDGFSDSILRVTRAFTAGILQGSSVETRKGDSSSDSSFGDRALDKLFSPAGSGFASVVIGSFAKNMIMAIYAHKEVNRNSIVNGSKISGDLVQRWVDVIDDDKCRKLIGDCIQQVASTMVTVYLDKTMDINPYEQILSGLSNAKHEEKARDLLAMVCNGAIETFVKTSHQVLTNSNTNGNSDSSSASTNFLRGSSSNVGKVFDGKELALSKPKARNNHANGRFVLDVTGRVTLATIKSFLGFSLNQFSEGMKKSGQEAYRYLTAKSLIVMTICISLCLHLLSSPWTLVSA